MLLGARSSSRPPLAAGIAVAVVGVAATTLLLYPLRDVAPVLSLGVVYLPTVLLVASGWGARLGAATAVVAALAFNFFHIPPTGRFAISEGENWVALSVLLVAALVTSSLAEAARTRALEAEQRRTEADLAAEMSRLLLRGGRLEDGVPVLAERMMLALGLSDATIELHPVAADEGRIAFPLRERDRQIGTLLVSKDAGESALRRVQLRIVPALEAVLAAALERDALLGERVETAALRRSDTVKTALLRSVSHDLRSPLTAILTDAEALRSPSLGAGEHEELVDAVTEEATRLSRLIDNLLDLSRLEGDAAAPQPAWCSVEEVLLAAGEDLGVPDGSIVFAIDRDLPPVRADAAQLERAFANLLDNAVRHSNGHPVSVRARDVGARILVRVVDRGPGVPPAQLDRIFEPFYRSGTDGTGYRGSGLGLAIVRGFIEANGGRVWVESLPGQATTFVVELPLDPRSEQAPA